MKKQQRAWTKPRVRIIGHAFTVGDYFPLTEYRPTWAGNSLVLMPRLGSMRRYRVWRHAVGRNEWRWQDRTIEESQPQRFPFCWLEAVRGETT